LKELKSAAKDSNANSSGDKVKSEKKVSRVYVRQIDDDKKLSAEAKAEIDKAAAKVKELASELQSKQKELVAARLNLSKLQGKLRTVTVVGRGNVDGKQVKGMTMAPMGRMGVITPDVIEKRLTVRRDAVVDGGQKRLDDLEKKLDQLLDEVASLKKDRAK